MSLRLSQSSSTQRSPVRSSVRSSPTCLVRWRSCRNLTDNVNHPAHYIGFSNGAEIIDITENLSFNLGNVVKYVSRAGRKTDDPFEDLYKAEFYLKREIDRLKGEFT